MMLMSEANGEEKVNGTAGKFRLLNVPRGFVRLTVSLLKFVLGFIPYHIFSITNSVITEGDGRLCFCRWWYVGRYNVCLWTTFWRHFKSDCHQTWSVILLATGDEMIKFWNVRVKDQGRWGRYALYWAILVRNCYLLSFLLDRLATKSCFNFSEICF